MTTNQYTIRDSLTMKVLGSVRAASEYKAKQLWCDNNGYRINLVAIRQ